MERKLTTTKSIKAWLEEVIQESLENAKKSKLHQAALDEKDKQDATAGENPDQQVGDDESLEAVLSDDQPEDDAGDDVSSGSEEEIPTSDSETMKNDDVKLDDVVDKLNTIRSGKSFKDSAIKAAMEKYIDGLEKPERTALLAFLKGIAQIVTGEIPGETATEPSENPSSVKIQKDPEAKTTSTQKKSIKPNVIKSPSTAHEPSAEEPQTHAGKKQKKPGVEDTSGPSPIVPKRRGV